MRLKTLFGIAALIALAPAAFGQDLFDFLWKRPAVNFRPTSLSFHPDGYFFVTGYNRACFAVTTADGLVIKTFDVGYNRSCRFGSFSPDGQFLAVSTEGFRGSVHFLIYETENWTLVETFYTDALFTNATGLLFSPNSRSLIGCLTSDVFVIDVPSFTRRFHAQASCPASISPNSELLLVNTSQGAKVLSLQDGSDRTPPSGYPGLRPPWILGDDWIALSEPNGIHVKTLTEPPQELAMIQASRPQALVRSPDDRSMGGAFDGGAGDKMIGIWETDGFSSIGSWPTGAPYDSGSVLAFTSDSESLGIAENVDQDPVKLWSVPGGTLQQVLVTDQASDTDLVFSADGQLLAGGFGQDGHIRLWQSADGALVQALAGQGRVTSLAFSPDGAFIASGGDNLNVWSLSDGTLIQSISEATIKVAISAQGLLAQQLADEARLRTLPDLSLVRTLPRGGPIAFSPDGRQILVGGDLFDVDSGSPLGSFSVEAPTISLFSPDGDTVAFADICGAAPPPGCESAHYPGDPVIKVFDAYSGDRVAGFGWIDDGFTSRGAPISSLVFSPDGPTLAQVSIRRDTPGEYPILRMWDVNGNLLRSYSQGPYSQGLERSLSYSPNGRYIAFRPANAIGVALSP